MPRLPLTSPWTNSRHTGATFPTSRAPCLRMLPTSVASTPSLLSTRISRSDQRHYGEWVVRGLSISYFLPWSWLHFHQYIQKVLEHILLSIQCMYTHQDSESNLQLAGNGFLTMVVACYVLLPQVHNKLFSCYENVYCKDICNEKLLSKVKLQNRKST